MKLITKADDERLDQLWFADRELSEQRSILLRDSLRAALEREKEWVSKLVDLREKCPGMELRAIKAERDLAATLAQLAEKEKQMCKARETADVFVAMCIDEALGFKVPYETAMNAARMIKERLFKDSSPCPHEEEAKRLREAIEWAMGDIAKDIARCVIPSGNKHYDDLKGQLRKNLELFRDELRRRAGEKL